MALYVMTSRNRSANHITILSFANTSFPVNVCALRFVCGWSESTVYCGMSCTDGRTRLHKDRHYVREIRA